MSGVITRSKSTKPTGNGTTHAHDDISSNGVNHTDVISNGFYGYKEGFETLEKTGVSRAFRHFMNKIFLPVCLILLTPQIIILVWYTNAFCNGSYTQMLTNLRKGSVIKNLIEIWSNISIVNSFTVGVVFGYCAWAIFWMRVLPGKRVTGPVTRKGNVPVYTDNGFLHYMVTMVGFLLLTIGLKMNGMTPTVVYDRFGELLAFMNMFALIFVFLLYLKGIYAPSSTDSGKTDGGFIFDYY